MAITLQFGVVSKKRNSTYIPTTELTSTQYASLKDGCSDHNPVFLLNVPNNVFAFNYVKWDNWYYFIDDVVRVHNQLMEIHCSLDVLATYKTEILATTCFVSYSSVSGGSWLPDTRIPIKNDTSVSVSSVNLPFVGTDPEYFLTVIGKSNGCATYGMDGGTLRALINNLSQDNDTELDNIMDMSFDTPEEAVEALTYALASTSLWSNAYANVPSCIRSCTWSLLNSESVGSGQIYLGDYDSGIFGNKKDVSPQTGSFSVSIPWQYSDWRRVAAEDVYLYLPYVGMISLSSENLSGESSLTILYSYTILDGNICFQIKAGNQIIGSYGGKCSGDYPIGLNQSAGVNEVANSFLGGAEKTVSVAAQGNILNAGNIAAIAGQAVLTGIDVKSTTMQKHPSCIGGIGGGAGTGLPKTVTCFTVAHGTSCEPSAMLSVMGMPTMKPLTLSSCTGYCECVNAHCSVAASGDAINMIDTFLNNGFYIE